MNKFLATSTNEFKDFIDAICSVSSSQMASAKLEPQYAAPNQIRGRLPPLSREGLPSLPFLLDHAKLLAQLVDLWVSHAPESIKDTTDDDSIQAFHSLCVSLDQRSKECLKAAEQAERPDDKSESTWQRMLSDQQKAITSGSTFEDQLRRSHAEADITALPQTTDTVAGMGYRNSQLSPILGEGEITPSSSTSAAWDRRVPFSNRPTDARAMTDSPNSSTDAIDTLDEARARPLPSSRDGPSKGRLFELISSSSRRKGKAGERHYADDDANEIS